MTRAFEICVRGDIPPELLRDLGDPVAISGPVETVLVTEPIDQAGLHRLLDRLRDLALELGELHRLPPSRRRPCALTKSSTKASPKGSTKDCGQAHV